MAKLDLHAASAKYLLRDKHLGAFIKKYGPLTHRRSHAKDAFQALAEAIIYQQLSGKAAGTILARFVALWPKKKPASPKTSSRGGFPTPEDILKIKVEKLRSVGLSGQKASYLKDLAAKFKDGTINPKLFSKMTDEEITAHVVAVKGIGTWTAHMFLMFTLGRPDVLPTGDLGIQKAFQKIFKLRSKPSPERMIKLAREWEGHRTVASMYLWRMIDGQ
jgi:3-methyladenine DNA glycosylase/8-oxoguanine DNA glycosylase